MTQNLIKGAAEFKHYHYEGDNDLMANLVALGQDPKYLIISCIDSRCNPGTIFRAPPGIFLSHKAMGAIVRPYHKGTALSAALQFALKYNKVETIIVLGHTQCGAIKALAEEIDDPEISSFVNVAKHGLDKAKASNTDPGEIIKKTERNVIRESAENLKQYPAVAKALEEKRVEVKAWQFDMKTGDLYEYDEVTDHFKTLEVQIPLKDGRKE